MRKNKGMKLAQSVRAKVIFDFMYEMLDGLEVDRDDYEKLRKRLEVANKTKLQATSVKIHSMQGAHKSLERDIKDLSLKILSLNKSNPIHKANDTHINELSIKSQELLTDIEKLQAQVTNPDDDVMTFEEFLNAANNAGEHLRAADVDLKDRIVRLIYLNVRADSEKVVDYRMRGPFKTYFETHKISNGRGDRT